MISQREIEALTKEMDYLASEEKDGLHYYYENTNNGRSLRRIENLTRNSDAVKNILFHPKVVSFISNIFSEEPVLFKGKFNLKLPGGAGFKPHLDGHFYWIDKDDNRRKGWLEYSPSFIIPL